MLLIRKRHLRAFDEPVGGRLECRIVAHVNRAFAGLCGRLGMAEVRRQVRQGIRRAAEYGIEAEYDVCRYVDLHFALGADFAAGEDGRWAGEVLRDARLGPSEKMDRLCRAAQQRKGPEAQDGGGEARRSAPEEL